MNYKKYLSWLLVLGFLGLAAWYGMTHQGMFSALLKIAPLWIALLFIGRLLTIYSNGLFTKTTVEAFSGKMSQPDTATFEHSFTQPLTLSGHHIWHALWMVLGSLYFPPLL